MRQIILLFTAVTAFAQTPAADDGSVTTPSGLKYKITRPGVGAAAQARHYITFHYTGKLPDGTVFFDTRAYGEPAVLQVGGQSSVVKGLAEGVALLPVDAKATFSVPAALAYGDKPFPRYNIPASTTLTFEVEVLGVKS